MPKYQQPSNNALCNVVDTLTTAGILPTLVTDTAAKVDLGLKIVESVRENLLPNEVYDFDSLFSWYESDDSIEA